ncbi:MAG: DUF6493 family protein [Rothia sp. (in: high G+C Gram-positive bacteria)]|uniref:DUF6493 family protein n=1 Tax=Rothia sp. (in: high G+C Gram-positive bacteria) TaxID=1885016 RepID=UPI0026DD9768|nr:DUF6493 family protein [Rothia sp. (in: high G+C Gram-positive bacteria)]MDO4883744.1 DUF6493 family protein [Rothia sp. (in: high G+C Gram-positive bacteria)]
MTTSENSTLTLTERRTRLKQLIAEHKPVEEYQKVLSGATEDERASLIRTLSPAKLKEPKNRFTPLGTYAVTALTNKPARATQLILQLCWDNFKHRNAIARYAAAGASERPNDWVLEYVAETCFMEELWPLNQALLRERGLICEDEGYLQGFQARIPAVTAASNHNHREALEFFAEDPARFEEFWALFRVEGTMMEEYAYGVFHPNGSMLALIKLLSENHSGFRDRVLTECLQAMLRDFSAANTRIFHTLYRGMNPTEAENLSRFGTLVSALGASPSTSVGLAQEMITPLIPQLDWEQAAELMDASAAVLLRTEKKVLRAQLRLLTKLVKTHPECAAQVSTLAAEAVGSMPLDVQSTARKLMIDEPAIAPSTPEAEGAAESIIIPDAAPRDREPGREADPLTPIADDAEFVAVLLQVLEEETQETQLPRLLAYLVQSRKANRSIAMDKATQERIYSHNKNLHYWDAARDELRASLSYLALKSYRLKLTHCDFMQKYRESYLFAKSRGPQVLLQEQFAYVDKPYKKELEPVVTTPLPAAQCVWERVAVDWSKRRNVYVAGRIVEGFPGYVGWRKLGVTRQPKDASFAEAALTAVVISADYSGNMEKAGTCRWYRLVVQWCAWLLYNNPDIFAAHMMPLMTAALYEKKVYGLEIVLTALAQSWRSLGAPAYCALGLATAAKDTGYRALAAETLATLADRDMFDTYAFSAELLQLLKDKYVPANRVVETLQDAASISPLAGWRICQVLQGLLPVVGELNRGGALVQLLVELAGEYGASVEIPEVLRPKMKGSTVLAKNLRALSALSPHPTELARQALEQANNANLA